jgi:hypothetical protein
MDAKDAAERWADVWQRGCWNSIDERREPPEGWRR